MGDIGTDEFTIDAEVVVQSSTLLRRRGIFKQGDDDVVVAVAALVVVVVIEVVVVVIAAELSAAELRLVTPKDGFCTTGGDCSPGLALVSQREHCNE